MTVVDNSAGACSSTSIAYDSSGIPHIAYFSSGANEIRFATRVPLFGWKYSTVATSIGGTSGGVNLGIDSSSN